MLKNIKYFLKHSFIYGVSNAAVKASGIILLPIYTNYFSVEEFGRLGLILAIIAILVQVVIMGQNHSLLRFSNQIDYQRIKKSIFFTIFLLVILITTLFIIIGEFITPISAEILGNFQHYYLPLKISIFIVAISILNNIFQSKLRADERSVFFTVLNLIKLVLLILLTIYLVAYKRLGINGVLYGQLFSEIFGFILIMPSMMKQMEFKFEKIIILESLKFGVPLIFVGLSMTLLNVSDRFIIKFLANVEALGLYELGYRIAGILNMLIIMPMSLTFTPIAYKIYKQPGDKEYYSKIMTYFTFILVWGALFLSIFSKEIVIIFLKNDSYLPAYKIVPVILYSYVFLGMSIISSVGILLKGKTIYTALVTIVAMVLNVGLNFILIPYYGIMGAAISTLIAFMLLYFLYLIVSNRYYKVLYEYRKLTILFCVSIAFFFLSTLLDGLPHLTRIMLKLFIAFVFPFLLSVFSFYDIKEVKVIKGFIKKWKNPSDWLSIIKSDGSDIFK